MKADSTVDTQFETPKRWPMLLVLGAVVVAIGGAVWALTIRREPLRTLIAVDVDGFWWEGSKISAELDEEVAVRLKTLGFDPVRVDDPKLLARLKDAATADEAALRARASFIITGKLDVEKTKVQLREKAYLFRAKGTIAVRHVDGPSVEAGTIESYYGSSDVKQTKMLLGSTLADQAFDVAVPALVKQPAVAALMKGTNISLRSKLASAQAYVEKRDDELSQARDAYARLLERFRDQQKGPGRPTYHGEINRYVGLCGVTENGFLAKAVNTHLLYSFDAQALGWVDIGQQLFWVDSAGKTSLFFQGHDVHGYPHASADGKVVAFAEDLFGIASAINTVRDGKVRRMSIELDRELSSPRVSKSGSRIAVWVRTCPTCSASLRVVDAASGEQLYQSDPKLSLAAFTWVADDALAYLYWLPPASASERVGPQRLDLIDLSAKPPAVSTLYDVPANDSLSDLSASADGRLIGVIRDSPDKWRLGVLNRETKKLTIVKTHRALDAQISPRGDAFALSDGNDIYYVRVPDSSRPEAAVRDEDDAAVAVTSDPEEERNPLFSPDGRLIYFEAHTLDPNFPRRVLSVVASVAVPTPSPAVP